MWQNTGTQTVTKLEKNKLWHELKDQIVTKLNNSNRAKLKQLNCDNSKTQIVIVIKITVVTEVVILTSFNKNTLTPWQPTNSQGSFLQFLRCFCNVSLTFLILIFFLIFVAESEPSMNTQIGKTKCFDCWDAVPLIETKPWFYLWTVGLETQRTTFHKCFNSKEIT